MKIRQILPLLAVVLVLALAVQPAAAEIDDEATKYYNIAEYDISLGNYEEALVYFDKVLASNTTLLGMGDGLMYTYKDRSGVLTDLGRYDEAIVTANEGLLRYPNSSGMWNNKGYAYFRKGDYNAAADAYGNAVRIDPTYLKGWINKGDALTKAGRSGEAVDAYRKALELDPGNAGATAGLAEAEKAGSTTTIVLALILVIAACIVVWYVKFRKPSEEDKTKKKSKGKKN